MASDPTSTDPADTPNLNENPNPEPTDNAPQAGSPAEGPSAEVQPADGQSPEGQSPENQTLAEVLAQFDYELPADQIEQLDAYRRVLWEWNEKMNLTRHTTLEKFVTRDVGDSWELANQLEKGERVLDVGSGGGVPGVILAIIRPDLDVSLCESVAKKAQALEDMVQTLGLDAKVYGARAEDLLEVTTFDTLVVRAVAPMRKLLFWLAPRWDAFDRLLLIKGRNWVAERGEARHYSLLNKLELRKVAEYVTRGADAVSVILKIEPKDQD